MHRPRLGGEGNAAGSKSAGGGPDLFPTTRAHHRTVSRRSPGHAHENWEGVVRDERGRPAPAAATDDDADDDATVAAAYAGGAHTAHVAVSSPTAVSPILPPGGKCRGHGSMSSMGGTPVLSTRHTGPRAADGSLDMRFVTKRGHDKWLD